MRRRLPWRPRCSVPGYSTTPMPATSARRALDEAGVEVLLSHRVESVEPGVVRARGRDGTRSWQADAIVLAVPHQDARAITPAPPVERAAGLGAAPIVNVHVIY